jgi:hypothetical protein
MMVEKGQVTGDQGVGWITHGHNKQEEKKEKKKK